MIKKGDLAIKKENLEASFNLSFKETEYSPISNNQEQEFEICEQISLEITAIGTIKQPEIAIG